MYVLLVSYILIYMGYISHTMRYRKLQLISPGLIQYLGGLIRGIKKAFRNEPQQCCSKYVFNLLVFNYPLKRHNKSNSFQF